MKEFIKDPESLPESSKGNQASAVSWNPGVEHLEEGLM